MESRYVDFLVEIILSGYTEEEILRYIRSIKFELEDLEES